MITTPSIKIVHMHTASGGSFLRQSTVLLLTRLFGRKAVMHIKGAGFIDFYNNSTPLFKRYIAGILRNADHIISLSGLWKENLSKISGNPNISVLYNPIFLKRSVYDEPVNPNEKAVNFLFMGRLGKRKGVYDIIEAAKLIRHPDVQLLLYGDGNVEKFRSLVKEAGLKNRIFVGDWVSGDEKEALYLRSHAMILPTYSEGLPNAVLEAMAYGLPIITTPVGGIPEAVFDCVNGYLLEPGDYKSLAKCIDMLASDPELRSRMGKASYKLAQERFDIKIISEQLEAIYQSVVPDKRTKPIQLNHTEPSRTAT
jgi:glycosyltransferase involved in cell wall biosynthesis